MDDEDAEPRFALCGVTENARWITRNRAILDRWRSGITGFQTFRDVGGIVGSDRMSRRVFAVDRVNRSEIAVQLEDREPVVGLLTSSQQQQQGFRARVIAGLSPMCGEANLEEVQVAGLTGRRMA